MNTSNNDVNVRWTVRVPRGVTLIAKTVNGSVQVTGLESGVDASTVNGYVDVSTTGWAQAATVNGDIDAHMGASAKWPDALDFRTINGNIRIDVPEKASATVRAELLNGGRVRSDIPMVTNKRTRRTVATGTLGGGATAMTLGVMNGSIELRVVR
jgi:DUF4097 and DUF4098 domain-containing protein YvlB